MSCIYNVFNNNNRNIVHDKCNMLELSQNHPILAPPLREKMSFTIPVQGAKRLGITGLEDL